MADDFTQEAVAAQYYRLALGLGIFTVVYNLVEGVVSVALGAQAEALTLFGFGVDSFIECLSGLGIVAMVIRIQRHPLSPRGSFERAALRVTGFSFYMLAAGLSLTALIDIFQGHRPETTLPGLVIAAISIAVMGALVWAKTQVGERLKSAPILADANCTRVCIYMSLVLLAASLIYQLTGFGFADSLGAIALVYFAVTEGREAFEKAASAEFDPQDQRK